jgi:hypothetical protein
LKKVFMEGKSSVFAEAPGLKSKQSPGASITQVEGSSCRLIIPAGPAGQYRLAQLDDYDGLRRRHFPWQPPFSLELWARASSANLPGTWGFGLWNNPFGMALTRGLEKMQLPVLPQAAWFFHASAANYLSLHDDLPAQGWLAVAFRSLRLPGWLALPGLPFAPLLAVRPVTRLLRRLGRIVVRQQATQLSVNPSAWHTYRLDWQRDRLGLAVDGEWVLETELTPYGPLGLVIWVDNQYMALPPDGRLSFGTLENPELAWIEIADLQIQGRNDILEKP